MANGGREDERTRLLRRLCRRRFDRIRFRGLDALVVRVPEDGSVSPADRRRWPGGPMRVYPVAGGYLYKWPHAGRADPPAGFAVEPGGWDHEHCDGCHRHINVGHPFWQTARGACYWLCGYCYRRLRQLARAGPGQARARRRPGERVGGRRG